ncbi:NAD-dependent epimerase/dehydratase family protein [Rhizobium sp. Leaf262]|uniref:NAD-dependent epimerase/dehydratase family protein n=1 Tax=Rhizobium sp. Leaf262 TaxID=1736312 RepID=UPI000712AA4A|nr:NAD-dependent epimerase/dehydratase family protein [Rhizobium sp. Leaf262]KQO79781.1 nucleoside-diphosphate sugar epimerase [Rhizobium sp. Leaf262]
MFLVTGGSGFVGQYLVKSLNQHGIAFRAASRSVISGHVPIGEINGSTDWTGVLRGVDTVVHLASCNQNVIDKREASAADFRSVNLDGTMRLAEQSAENGVGRFVFISTVKVNGERSPPLSPFKADAPLRPQTDYALSKSEAEQRLTILTKESGMELVIIRPPLVYGWGAKGSFNILVKLVRSGFPLPLASLNNRRSIVYVENLVDLILMASSHKAAVGQTFMVADGPGLSTPDLVRQVARAMNRSVRLFPCPLYLLRNVARATGKGAMVERLIDSLEVNISHTRSVLDWTPPFSLEEGIRRSI